MQSGESTSPFPSSTLFCKAPALGGYPCRGLTCQVLFQNFKGLFQVPRRQVLTLPKLSFGLSKMNSLVRKGDCRSIFRQSFKLSRKSTRETAVKSTQTSRLNTKPRSKDNLSSQFAIESLTTTSLKNKIISLSGIKRCNFFDQRKETTQFLVRLTLQSTKKKWLNPHHWTGMQNSRDLTHFAKSTQKA